MAVESEESATAEGLVEDCDGEVASSVAWLDACAIVGKGAMLSTRSSTAVLGGVNMTADMDVSTLDTPTLYGAER